MAFVNKVNIKTFQLSTCLDFAECFISMITNETIGYNEVRIIFDRYDPKSLKSNTRATRTKGLSSARYKICDTTKIGHLETNNFISSINTKSDLTEYLGKKLEQNLTVDVAVVYGNTTLTNISSLSQDLLCYSNEETETGMVLHALDVSRNDPVIKMVVSYSDTDVLLIFLSYFKDLPCCTTFKTYHHKYDLQKTHEILYPDITKALLGFHAFSGCD